MILTYKYRIKDRSARKTLRRHAYAVNQVWNYCNAVQRDIEARYRAGAPKRKWPGHFDLQKLTKGTSKELGINAQTIGSVCEQFAKSRDKAKRSLRFRASGGAKRALGWVPFQKQSRQIEDNSVWYLGKRYRWFGNKRRPLPDSAKGGMFVEDALGRWYVCFHVEAEDRPTGNAMVGIDLGLNSLAALSDGRHINTPSIYRRYEQKLAVAQRANNKRRAKAIHAKIKECRKDFIHKATTTIARESALIAVGDISVSRLVKTRMAKSVLDAGWAMFRSQLRYKASRHGAVYLGIDEKFTTQTCSECGALPPERPKGTAGLGISAWDCSACGASHDRDVNAARNILARALSVERPVEESRSLQSDSHIPRLCWVPREPLNALAAFPRASDGQKNVRAIPGLKRVITIG
jgi:putative transposase